MNCNLQTIQKCLDDYMSRNGKTKIGDIEANRALAIAGVMNEDQAHPGRPLRAQLRNKRDTKGLPQNIRQLDGTRPIIHSRPLAKGQKIIQI